MSAIIREPQLEDARALARVHVAAWQLAYEGMMPADFLSSLTIDSVEERWRGWLASADIRAHVLELQGRVVGFCSFSASRDASAAPEVGEIQGINLHPDFWRQGLGSKLLESSLQALRAEGFAVATLWVLDQNAAARCFYEARGWHADGGSKLESRAGGLPLQEVRYRIELSP